MMNKTWLTSIFYLLFTLVITKSSYACSVCFSQVKDDPHTIALGRGIIILLLIVAVPLILFAKFLFQIYKREQLLAEKN